MKKLFKEDFIKKCNINHKNKYIYDYSNFNGLEREFNFDCPKHGTLKMIAKKHYNNGCRYCNGEKRFIEKSKIKHNLKYDYSDIIFSDNNTKVKIICPKHGYFLQTPEAHLKGQGCPLCKKLDIDDLKNKIKNKHGDKYNIDNISYKNALTKFKVICPEHGIFDMCPKNLSGCKSCANKKLSLSNNIFIDKSIIIHNNKYDYSLVNYINNKNPVDIICPKHGKFSQRPDDHLSGHGCKYCKISSGEEIISNILKDINFIREHKFPECKNDKVLSFDFYLPDINCCIEFNGKQHYEPITFFGGNDGYLKNILRDNIKVEFCKKNNIKLLIVSYLEKDIYNIVIDFVNQFLQ